MCVLSLLLARSPMPTAANSFLCTVRKDKTRRINSAWFTTERSSFLFVSSFLSYLFRTLFFVCVFSCLPADGREYASRQNPHFLRWSGQKLGRWTQPAPIAQTSTATFIRLGRRRWPCRTCSHPSQPCHGQCSISASNLITQPPLPVLFKKMISGIRLTTRPTTGPIILLLHHDMHHRSHD